MSLTSMRQVLIAGGGPSGLILALALAQNGIRVRIIEKDSKFHVGQRGSGIQPRSLELYHLLGILPEIRKSGTPLLPMCRYKMPEGREPLQIQHLMAPLENTPNLPYANPLMLGQSHLMEIVCAHLKKYDVHPELGTELVSFEQDDERVTSQVIVRKDGQEHKETIESEYLVSAEGARSIVRKQLGLTFLGETRDNTRTLVVDMYIKGLSNEYWHSWGGADTPIANIRPTEYEGLYTVMITGPNFNPSDYMHDRERIIEYIYEATNRRDLEFGEIQWMTDWRANIRMVNKFGEGRVFLVGDAAHVHSPTGGQGNNTGAQDSFNLGWKLALAIKKLATSSLLDTYSVERLPVVREMLNITTKLLDENARYRADSADRPAVSRPKSLHQLGVNYRRSPIVVDEQEHGEDIISSSACYLDLDSSILCAGDRAPDASGLVIVGNGQDETRLFDIFKLNRHTALIFDPTTEEDKKIIGALSAVPQDVLQIVLIFSSESLATQYAADAPKTVLTVFDREGHARNGYPPVKSGYNVIIVRPDDMVGAVVKSSAGVEKYLQKVFAL